MQLYKWKIAASTPNMVDDYYLYIYVYLYIYLYIYKHLGVPRIGNYRISRRQIYENAFFFCIANRFITFFSDCDTSCNIISQSLEKVDALPKIWICNKSVRNAKKKIILVYLSPIHIYIYASWEKKVAELLLDYIQNWMKLFWNCPGKQILQRKTTKFIFK